MISVPSRSCEQRALQAASPPCPSPRAEGSAGAPAPIPLSNRSMQGIVNVKANFDYDSHDRASGLEHVLTFAISPAARYLGDIAKKKSLVRR
jgi:hypothetical protein